MVPNCMRFHGSGSLGVAGVFLVFVEIESPSKLSVWRLDIVTTFEVPRSEVLPNCLELDWGWGHS